MLTPLWAILIASAGALCAGDQSAAPLRLNDIQTVGTHNSYKQHLPADELTAHRAVDPRGADSIDYGFAPLSEQLDRGVRQIELDVYADTEGGRYLHPPGARRAGYPVPPWSTEQAKAMAQPGMKVMHLADIDFRSSCVTWIACLEILKTWSDAHPHHTPVLILVNAKDDPLGPGSVQPIKFDTAAFDMLDAETRSVLPPAVLITPDEVQGAYPTLRDAVLADRWPLLQSSRGKFLFVLDETPAKVAAYRGNRVSLEGRVMFVGTDEASPLGSILVLNDPVTQGARITRAVKAGFIVRTRADADTREARSNDTARSSAAFRSGAQYISTDYFVADRRLSDYRVRLEQGMITRINPLRGAHECRDARIE